MEAIICKIELDEGLLARSHFVGAVFKICVLTMKMTQTTI
jgi:hypothetical protein